MNWLRKMREWAWWEMFDFSPLNMVLCLAIIVVLVFCLAGCTRKVEPNENMDVRAKSCVDTAATG